MIPTRTHTKFIYVDDITDDNINVSQNTDTNVTTQDDNKNTDSIYDIITYIKDQYTRFDYLNRINEDFEKRYHTPTFKENLYCNKIMVDTYYRICSMLYKNRNIILNYYSPETKNILLKTVHPNSNVDFTLEIKINQFNSWLDRLLKIYEMYHTLVKNNKKRYPKLLRKINNAYDNGDDFLKFILNSQTF
jgi:hypothetical protein